MAKRQILLFELLKEDDKSKHPESLWDRLFRKKVNLEPQPQKSAEEEEQQPVEQREEAVSEETETGEDTSLYLRINTHTKVLAAVLVVVIFFCGYILGHSRGWRDGTKDRSDLQMAEIQKQPADSEVFEVLTKHERVPVASSTEAEKPATEEVSKNDGKMTRNIGVNYLIIQNFSPEGLATAEVARDFLARMGIETTIERYGKVYQLISLQGFDMSDPQAKEQSVQFKKQIEVLGKKFKQEPNSRNVEFRDCYYQRWN
jgi:hypothetical protein